MAAAPRLRGGGVDPLFTVAFYAAAIVNMITALVPEPTPLETLIVGGLHAAFLARVTRARQVAGSQRARDLRAYQETRAAAAASSAFPPASSVRPPRNPRTSEVGVTPACRRVVQSIEGDPICGAFCRPGDTECPLGAPARRVAIALISERNSRAQISRPPRERRNVRGTLFARFTC